MPPAFVFKITFPFPSPCPVRAMTLLGDFHSADNRQFTPQIVRPEIIIQSYQNDKYKNTPSEQYAHPQICG